MSFSLRSNFFAHARGITFTDGGGVTWSFNANTNVITATAAGGVGVGTVTSVGLADGSGTALYTITGSPVAASGTLTFTLKTQLANLVLAGATSGGAAQPTFRSLVLADIPTISAAHTSGFATVATSGAYADLSGTPSIPVGASPSASVGLAAVNGSALTWMRSDGAPALSVSITPTWTGAHVWAPGSAVTAIKATAFSAASLAFDFIGLDNSNIGFFRAGGTSGGNLVLYDTGASAARGFIGFGAGGIMSGGAITDVGISAGTGGTVRIPRAGVGVNAFAVGPNGNVTIAAPSSGVSLAVTGTTTISSGLGVNGAAAPAQVTGFGTPVGGAVVASYNITDAGGANSNTNKCVAEILTVLKAAGIIGA